MFRTRFVSSSVALGVLLATAGCAETDPAKPATWVAKLDNKDKKVVADALDHLGKMKAKEAVPQIVAQLKSEDGHVREEAAGALADIGDKAAVQPLIDAVDMASSDKGVRLANLKIADALGSLGDLSATPMLQKMLKTHDDFLKDHAVQSMGKLLDPKTVPDLIDLVNNDRTQTLVTKHAIMVLGDMRAKESVPVLAKALVMERNGVSFFVEASYALFQIGSPSLPALLALVDGTDKEYIAWADSQNRKMAGVVSKAAIVLADIGDPAAIPSLVKAVNWKDPDDNTAFTSLVRGTVAEALGRLRAKAAAAPLANTLATMDEANMRARYAVALAHIADPSALPKLEAAVKNVKDSWTDRQETITGLAMFGDARQKPVLEQVQKVETEEKTLKECLALAADAPAPVKEKCTKISKDRPQFIADEIARLMTGDECKQDLACWTGKLKDKSPKIRERAAYEIGKLGTPAAVDALMTATKDDTMFVRRAVYIGLDWLSGVDAAKPALKAKADVLAAQFEGEKSSALTQIVNEDLKRVVWKVQHL